MPINADPSSSTFFFAGPCGPSRSTTMASLVAGTGTIDTDGELVKLGETTPAVATAMHLLIREAYVSRRPNEMEPATRIPLEPRGSGC